MPNTLLPCYHLHCVLFEAFFEVLFNRWKAASSKSKEGALERNFDDIAEVVLLRVEIEQFDWLLGREFLSV
jgi:hypothetical protein